MRKRLGGIEGQLGSEGEKESDGRESGRMGTGRGRRPGRVAACQYTQEACGERCRCSRSWKSPGRTSC